MWVGTLSKTDWRVLLANFVKHTACPKCNSSDAFANYGELGGGHCFSCHYTVPSEEYKEDKKASVKLRKMIKEKDITLTETKSNSKPVITEDENQTVKEKTFPTGNDFRGIRDDVYKYFGVRHSLSDDGEVTAQYYPVTQEGELSGYKIREVPKNFRSMGRTGADCDLFMSFRFNRGGKYIVITEGEVCALSAYQILKDYNNKRGSDFEIAVVSPTTGASSQKQIANNYKFLDSFDFIILAMDQDKAGKDAVEKIIPVLPKGKVKIMTMRYKDHNEYLEKDKQKEYIADFYDAKTYVPVGIMASSDLYDKILQQASVPKTPFPPWMGKLNEMFVGGMPGNAIINIAADTGLGKTTLVNAMVEYWIFNSPHTVGVVSMELDASQYGEALLGQYVHRKISLIADVDERMTFLKSDAIKAKAGELFAKEDGSPRFYLLDNRDGSVEDIQDTIEELVVGCGAKIIILDPLQDVLDGLSNEEQSLFMKWAKGLIKSHGTTLVLINHMKKTPMGQSGADHESNIMGSSTIIKSASANILLKRDKMSDDPVTRNSTEIIVSKNRLYGITGPAGAVYYDNNTARLHNLDNWLNENM